MSDAFQESAHSDITGLYNTAIAPPTDNQIDHGLNVAEGHGNNICTECTKSVTSDPIL